MLCIGRLTITKWKTNKQKRTNHSSCMYSPLIELGTKNMFTLQLFIEQTNRFLDTILLNTKKH